MESHRLIGAVVHPPTNVVLAKVIVILIAIVLEVSFVEQTIVNQ